MSPFKGSTCTVTGQTGFIGEVLARDLKEEGANLVPPEGGRSGARVEMTSRKSVKRLFETQRPDFVFHLAGATSVPRSWQIPRKYFDVNVRGTYNMLESLHDRGDADDIPFVFASSSSVYGVNTGFLISEDSNLNPVNPYALTKASAETLCRSFNSVFRMETMIARPFYVAGPGLTRGVIHELAHNVALAESGRSVRELGVSDPKVVIDVVDVRDCSHAMETIAVNGRGGESYNVCRGEGHSLGEIAEIIISLTKARLKLVTTGKKRQADVPRLVGSPAKLMSLGWSARHTLEEVLVAVLEGCRSEIRSR